MENRYGRAIYIGQSFKTVPMRLDHDVTIGGVACTFGCLTFYKSTPSEDENINR